MAKKNSDSKKPIAVSGGNNKSKFKISKQNGIIIGSIFLALVLFGVSGWLWWTKIFTDSSRVFDDMLNNSLSSSSVGRRVVQEDTESSVNQAIFVSFRPPEVVSQTKTILSEKGLDRKTTTVTTETIGTENDDFVRYISADGAENLSVSANLDQVLGVWGKRSADQESGVATAFLDEALFTIVPFGDLTPEQRTDLIQYMNDKEVYTITGSKKEFSKNRYVYSYDVDVNPQALVEVLAKYVELTGVGSSAQLNPASYEGSGKVKLKMKVDILSRQLMSIEYLSTGRTETIESRNLYRDVSFPPESIPFQELQNRLLGQGGAANSGQTQQTQTN